MLVLRTPESAFRDLPDFRFAPHYVDVWSDDVTPLRVHYLDEGSRDAPTLLMLHGEPTWSFLFRNLIARCTAAGIRSVAPDLVGCGRSDKPARRDDYSYQRHVDWMHAVIEQLELNRIVLLCHDWGGLIGLRLVAEHPERFAGVIAMNTTLPTGDHPSAPALLEWQQVAEHGAEFPAGRYINEVCVRPLRSDVIAAYDAPFPEETYKAGVRRLPSLVPTTPGDPASSANRRAWTSLATFTRPFLTVFGRHDPYTEGGQRAFQRRVPGAVGQPHITLSDAGHFVPEDSADALADSVIGFVQRLTP
jgi:haloalkane dehalogenase